MSGFACNVTGKKYIWFQNLREVSYNKHADRFLGDHSDS